MTAISKRREDYRKPFKASWTWKRRPEPEPDDDDEVIDDLGKAWDEYLALRPGSLEAITKLRQIAQASGQITVAGEGLPVRVKAKRTG